MNSHSPDLLKILDNVVWQCLTGSQSHFALGRGAARRYANGFSPILGFEDQADARFSDIEDVCTSGESFYTDGWAGPVPDGWVIEREALMLKMVWTGPGALEVDSSGMVGLEARHAPAALELAELTNPGPFGIRTIELGDYFGFFEGDRLVAMAGERMHAGPFREISGVCTHPEFQGRGMARKLMLRLVELQLSRGQTPFLHVMSANEIARGLYRRMGFTDYLESVVRVVSKR